MATITSPRDVSPNPSRITSPGLHSTKGSTPASSVRTSFELQSVSGSNSNLSTPTITATPNQRRNRAALRDYYNIKARSGAGAGTGAGAATTSPTRRRSTDSDSTIASSNITLTVNKNGGDGSILPPQIDDPTFDADKYITDLLKTSTLREILKAESTLVSEIRNLDGERKALVYDNYSKLIKAVGTIGDMQKGMRDQHNGQQGKAIDGVKGLDGKLEDLMSLIRSITGETGEIQTVRDKSASENRKSLKAEREKQNLVRWVLDAPNRLKDLAEAGKKEQAESEWEKVSELLEKWKGVEGVEEVKQACKEVMDVKHGQDSAEVEGDEND